MKVGWETRTDINKFSDTLNPRSLMEVTCCNRFPKGGFRTVLKSKSTLMGAPHNIEIGASRYDVHLLELHNILQLHSNFSCFPEEFWMEEMTHCPIVAVPWKFSKISRKRYKKKLVHIGLESKSNLLVALPLVEDIQ